MCSGQDMRNRGLCLVKRVSVFNTYRPNVKVTEHTYLENSKKLTRTEYETPKGTLSTLTEHAGITAWSHEKMFKTPDDYEALLFLIQDEVYEPAYDATVKSMKAAGGDNCCPGFKIILA